MTRTPAHGTPVAGAVPPGAGPAVLRPPGWVVTSGHRGAVVTGVLLLAAGLVTGRADVALLGLPVLLTTLWAARGPGEPLTARLDEPPGEARPGELTATLVIDAGHPLPGAPASAAPRPPSAVRLAHLRVGAPGHRVTETVVAAGPGGRQIPLRLASVRTGPQETFDVGLRGYDTTGIHEQPPVVLHGSRRLVLPGTTPLGAIPLTDALRGTTGPHASRRLGDGTELRDIHPFTPGDRLRRIDWRATARRSPGLDELYVRRTLSTAEATAMLVIDSRDDVGPDIRTWRGYATRRPDEATSLDLARHAAASVAAQLVTGGDRVGVEDLARRRRPVPPATGRRHLRRLTHALALAHPTDNRATGHDLRPPRLPAGAVVYLFTTLLDDEILHLVSAWRTLAHPVVVIDTLPRVHPVRRPHLHLAWRILRLERDERVTGLAHTGVPVITWDDTGTTPAAARQSLAALARARHGQHTRPGAPNRRPAS